MPDLPPASSSHRHPTSSKSGNLPARSFSALTHRLVRFAHIASRFELRSLGLASTELVGCSTDVSHN